MPGKVNVLPSKFNGYGLVRDPSGKPKFDDPANIPQQLWDMLSPGERAAIELELPDLPTPPGPPVDPGNPN